MTANELADELEAFGEAVLLGKSPFTTHAAMLRQQQAEIDYWKEKFNKAMDMQEEKPAKYTDAWWKEVAEFNKQLKEQEK
jgi:hypothetical protein